MPLMEARAILFARHIKGYQVRPVPDDSSSDDNVDSAGVSHGDLAPFAYELPPLFQPVRAEPTSVHGHGSPAADCKQQ